MKIHLYRSNKSMLLVCLAIAFFVANAKATGIFPIATNASVVEFGGPILFDGTNYMAALVSGTNWSVQRISANGALLGPLVNVGKNPGFPPAAAFASGQTNYLAAWSDSSIRSGVDMFGQFVTRSGEKFGPTFNLLQSQGAHGFQTLTALASDGTNFLAVWQDKNNRYFYSQLVTSAGTLSGSEFLISSQQQNAKSAAVTFCKTNYLVVWQSNNNDTGNDEKTYGALVSLSGVPGSPFQISQTTSTDQNPLAVAFDGTNCLVVWNWDIGPGTGVVTNWDIYGRLVSQTGTFPGSEMALVTDPGSQVVPSLAFDGSNYLMAWGDGSFNTTNSTIRFRFFDRSASPVGPSFTPFSAQGTNAPLFAFNGLLFDGTQFVVAATLGTAQLNSEGDLAGFPSLDIYGGFIPRSTAPPRLDLAGPLAGTQFPLLLTGTPGINYAIQTLTNLASTNWTVLVTNSPTNGTFNFTDTDAANTSRFYRAVKQ